MTTYTAILQKEDETYIATCPEIGTVSQGKTIEEAVKNLKEATTLYLDEFPLKKSHTHSITTTFEVEEVVKT